VSDRRPARRGGVSDHHPHLAVGRQTPRLTREPKPGDPDPGGRPGCFPGATGAAVRTSVTRHSPSRRRSTSLSSERRAGNARENNAFAISSSARTTRAQLMGQEFVLQIRESYRARDDDQVKVVVSRSAVDGGFLTQLRLPRENFADRPAIPRVRPVSKAMARTSCAHDARPFRFDRADPRARQTGNGSECCSPAT